MRLGAILRIVALCAVLGLVSAGQTLANVAPGPAPQGSTGSPGLRLLIGDQSAREMGPLPVIRIGPPEAFANLGSGGEDALTCLTQAIYYEARSESVAGQEAVAQVVVNRTRRAEFPHSVCGVVFQGGERASGCQFSFVCDGSLRDPADDLAWERARTIAQQALAGFEYKPLLDATHYHAAWVTPYWSGRMKRIRKIGAHVFYR
jgi:hypothetical protein